MSAALADVVMVVPACDCCRRHRASSDSLRCTEQRSSAVGGVVIPVVSAARQARTYYRITRELAGRCKFYQEER